MPYDEIIIALLLNLHELDHNAMGSGASKAYGIRQGKVSKAEKISIYRIPNCF